MNKQRENKDFSFKKRAASYDEGIEGRMSQKFYNLVLQSVDLYEGCCVLDVGCGTGALLKGSLRTIKSSALAFTQR